MFESQQGCDDVIVNIVQTLPLIIKMFYTIKCKRLHELLFKNMCPISNEEDTVSSWIVHRIGALLEQTSCVSK
ncbi:hypothetical protein GCM10025878_16720 [Leuconostoc gasicomitatum]|nr:hypothetical protein GCM10025878_16720 [Leuconostoc gasicomitatum]